MKKPALILAVLTATLGGAIPFASANTNHRPKVEKTTDVSDDPAVKAAQKARDDAETALEAAKAKSDKTAIDAAQKALDAAEAKLKQARKAAEKAAEKAKHAKTTAPSSEG